MQRSNVKNMREAFCSARKPASTSHIYCDRPIETLGTIPMTLLHPAFGHFKDDCEKFIPAAEDFALPDSIVVEQGNRTLIR